MNLKPTLLIVGAGNVSWHLCMAFSKKGFDIKGIVNRTKSNTVDFQKAFDLPIFDFEHYPDTDVILIAVSDNEINNVSNLFLRSKALIVHTSGAVSIDKLSEKIRRKGVFYPFQTFTKYSQLTYQTIPIFVETKNEYDQKILKNLSEAFSGDTYYLDSSTREGLHLAGVFGNNFVNCWINESVRVLEQHNISAEVIWPLITETVEKAKKMGPKKSQTGPAIRGDDKTIEQQLKKLNDNKALQKLYLQMTERIQNPKD